MHNKISIMTSQFLKYIKNKENKNRLIKSRLINKKSIKQDISMNNMIQIKIKKINYNKIILIKKMSKSKLIKIKETTNKKI